MRSQIQTVALSFDLEHAVGGIGTSLAGPRTNRRDGPPYVVDALLAMHVIGILLRINLRIAVSTTRTAGSRKR